MDMKIIIFLIGTWFLFMVLAIINAAVRNNFYQPIIGELRAHQLSTVIFISLIFLLTYIIIYLSDFSLSNQEAFIIGFLWMIFTICFEFIAGRYVFKNSWVKLFSEYNLLKGRIWILVLITLFISPILTSKI